MAISRFSCWGLVGKVILYYVNIYIYIYYKYVSYDFPHFSYDFPHFLNNELKGLVSWNLCFCVVRFDQISLDPMQRRWKKHRTIACAHRKPHPSKIYGGFIFSLKHAETLRNQISDFKFFLPKVSRVFRPALEYWCTITAESLAKEKLTMITKFACSCSLRFAETIIWYKLISNWSSACFGRVKSCFSNVCVSFFDENQHFGGNQYHAPSHPFE